MPETIAAGQRAEIAQRSLDHFWGAPAPQLFDNVDPEGPGTNATFNYWWLAHVVDCRLDAYERTSDVRWRDEAVAVAANIVERNGGSLFNDYFDDMLWLALASHRLAEAGAGAEHLAAAVAIWDHVVEHGWNAVLGPSLAWRKQQLDYKNTPANGPLVILSLRLARATGEQRYVEIAERAYAWLTEHLIDPETGFVEDGINRSGDGRIDTQWRFTYNQGLVVGANVELFRTTGERSYLDRAARTARTAIDELSDGVVFADEGDGGDEGLFKGVYFRYLGQLVAAGGDPDGGLADFVHGATGVLWDTCFDGEWLRASNSWREPASGPVAYSTQLSAIMALELVAGLDEGRGADLLVA